MNSVHALFRTGAPSGFGTRDENYSTARGAVYPALVTTVYFTGFSALRDFQRVAGLRIHQIHFDFAKLAVFGLVGRNIKSANIDFAGLRKRFWKMLGNSWKKRGKNA